MKRFGTMLVFVLFASTYTLGCSSMDTPGAAYISADEATYNAVWPPYWNYIQNDPNLADWQKASKADTGASWKARINEGKKANAAAQSPNGVAPTTTGGK